MIGSFWNLCRACPSMPVDKLHSEYRSTYKWHEFKQAPLPGGVVRQPVPAPPASNNNILAREPIEPAIPRRKKYPGVAYKSNEIFDITATSKPVNHVRLDTTATLDRARSVERESGRNGASRRSKSEGRQQKWADTIDGKAPPVTIGDEIPVKEQRNYVSTEYRNQFAWPKDGVDSAGQPRKSISMGTIKLAAQQNIKKKAILEGTSEVEPLMNHTNEHTKNEHKMMNGQVPTATRHSAFRSALTAFITNSGNNKDNRKNYKSEYKKKFRPFSQYVYEASKGTFTKCRGLKGKPAIAEKDDGASEKMLKPDVDTSQDVVDSANVSNSWYKEVLDLRKRAGEYKYRGWGTELAPEHITQLYNKQIELWNQVSKRSSLSALALATTNHRALMKDDKEKDTSQSRSPKKLKSFRGTPNQSIHLKLLETRNLEKASQKTSPQKAKKKIQGQSFDETTVDGHPEIKSDYKSPKRRPRSADPHGPNERIRPQKPTGLPLHTSRVKSSLQNGAKVSTKKSPTTDQRRSRSVSKSSKKSDDYISPHPRSASVAKEHFYDDSPVVKSPPEPTRVKSPEQMNMRSPDPVNWTVPLDTGKTFTVTQNVKNDDSIRRPCSDFKGSSICEEDPKILDGEEMVPIHQLSPKRTLKLKSESPTNFKKRDSLKTPTTPQNLTPIDETKALDLGKPMANGNLHVKNSPTTVEAQSDKTITKLYDPAYELNQSEPIKKSTEVIQDGDGSVNTTILMADVLERARNRFDKFWGKKEENDTV